MDNIDKKFLPFKQKMESESLPEIVIRTFRYYYNQLLKGESGIIYENDISSVDTLPDLENFDEKLKKVGEEHLHETVFIKLNGGLGTGMGLNKAKSLLKIKNNLTFLDIIANQAIKTGVPLVLMNSFNTHEDSEKYISRYPGLTKGIPHYFLQHKIPKIEKESLAPVNFESDKKLEWCPPGHGEIYAALVISGILKELLSKNYKYAFISNSDNLGAILEPKILGYIVSNDVPFLMEVADRTESDKKGGHLARLKNGQLVLRESAQCAEEDIKDFQNIKMYKYFNTNNIWIDLRRLKQLMEEKDYILGLPMIRNEKTVDPRNNKSTVVYQLETAMGSAISVFKNAEALRVPKTRFAPVKTTNDLLEIRSDAYILTDDYRLVHNPERKLPKLYVELDPRYYKKIDDFEKRFPFGAPSLIECEELSIKGDIYFGKNVKLIGKNHLINENKEPVFIADDEVIENHRD